MKIQTISVQKVKNLGKYQSERLEMVATVNEGEDPEAAALTLRLTVEKLLNQSLPNVNNSDASPF